MRHVWSPSSLTGVCAIEILIVCYQALRQPSSIKAPLVILIIYGWLTLALALWWGIQESQGKELPFFYLIMYVFTLLLNFITCIIANGVYRTTPFGMYVAFAFSILLFIMGLAWKYL